MLGGSCVAVDLFSAGLGVHGVQVQPVPAGDQAEGLVQVGAQFVGRARLAGIVAGGQMPPPEPSPVFSKPPTSSPCQQCRLSWDLRQASQRRVSVHPQLGIALLGQASASCTCFSDG